MITAVIDGHAYSINDKDENLLVGTGGEADVYRFMPNAEFVRRHGNLRYVLKLFRKATARATRERQARLEAFPGGFSGIVIESVALAFSQISGFIGYVMPFVPNGTPLIEFKGATFRRENSVTTERILRIMANVHDGLTAVHARRVVVGDFNDKNVLVLPDDTVCFLDADSFQFDRWECPAFVPNFVDPQIVEPRKDKPSVLRKVGSYSKLTDWYAFTVMLFQLLVRVPPLTGGTYVPAHGEAPLTAAQRIHRRISVFHPQVSLSDIATPLDQIPADLLRYFQLVFEQEHRGVFPKELLLQAARTTSTTRQSSARTTTSTRHQPPSEVLLAAALQGGQPRYVTYHDGAYRRETEQAFWTTPCDPRISAIPAGDRTVMASDGMFVVFDGARHSNPTKTQVAFGRTTVTANSRCVYWLRESELVRDDRRGGVFLIEKIAANSTSIWAGERFGVALEQAGIFTKISTFTDRNGFHTLTLPPDFGSVIDAQCAVGDDLAWLTLSVKTGGRTVNRCYVIDAQARLQATATANQGDGTWLGSVTPAAHATGTKLLVPVPRSGIVRVGITAGRPRQELVYTGSSAFVPNKNATVGLTYDRHGVLHYTTTSINSVAPTL